MGFSMSTVRRRGLPGSTGTQAVLVWGADGDGRDDGSPAIVARGRVTMSHDGPGQCRITAPDGTVYATAEPAWAPLAHEWVCDAVRLDKENRS